MALSWEKALDGRGGTVLPGVFSQRDFTGLRSWHDRADGVALYFVTSAQRGFGDLLPASRADL